MEIRDCPGRLDFGYTPEAHFSLTGSGLLHGRVRCVSISLPMTCAGSPRDSSGLGLLAGAQDTQKAGAAVPEPSLEQALQAQDGAWCWLLDRFSNLVPVVFTELHAQSF